MWLYFFARGWAGLLQKTGTFLGKVARSFYGSQPKFAVLRAVANGNSDKSKVKILRNNSTYETFAIVCSFMQIGQNQGVLGRFGQKTIKE